MCEEKECAEKPQKSRLGRFLKICLWAAAVGFVLLLACPLWLGPVVRITANAVVPSITGTAFEIGSLWINPYGGTVSFSDFRVGNPEGYDVENAASVKSFSIDVAWTEFFTANRVHVRDLEVVGPFGSYIGHNGTNNVDAILAHVNATLGSSETVEADVSVQDPAPQNPSDAALSGEKKEEAPAEELKFVIDRIHVEGGSVRMGLLPLPIPPFTITGIGSESGGVSFGELCSELGNRVMRAGSAGVDALGGLGSKSGKSLKNAGAAAGDLLSDGVKSLGDGAKSVGDSAKALGDGAKDLVKGVGDLFGGKK